MMTTLTDTCEMCDEKAVGSVVHPEYKTRLYFCAEHETAVCDHTDLYCAFRDPFLEIRRAFKIDVMLDWLTGFLNKFNKTKHKLCAHCQYCRQPMKVRMFTEGDWCSNSRSRNSLKYITGFDTCDQFADKRKKAPLWMRIAKKVMK